MSGSPSAPATTATPASWRAATLAPFKNRIFLSIWTASLISNFGGLIQVVGASWLMTALAPGPDMVALVQTFTSLPVMLLALSGGAIADVWDRRRIMLIAQVLMLAVSAALAVVTHLHLVTPWSLLAMTFLIGCGTALYGPAWQSSVGEQVPRAQLSAAIALNILAFNIARTLGPAIGGVIVATAGAQVAFIVNALSYIGLIIVLLAWRRSQTPSHLPPESILDAMRTGVRYVRIAPPARSVLMRAFLFGLLGSAIWALMPVIARDLIRGGARTYGLLFGAFGAGAVVGGLLSVSVRMRFSGELIVRVASVVFGITAIVAALSHSLAMTAGIFVAGGASWVLTLSTFNITIQTCTARWVVGRALAAYQMATFGGLALGSSLWGILADRLSISSSLLIAGGAMLASVLVGFVIHLPEPGSLNLDPHKAQAEPTSQFEVEPESGPVVVSIEYRIAAADQEAFLAVMHQLRRIRRRDGARRWTLLQDVAQPEVWVERFQNPTWVERLRHHHRQTISDRQIEERAFAFHRGAEPPRMRHLLKRSV
ncbi:MAG TPA: MFS transporter [Steroidobacteraceae bacterium]|nr:MFS transporter [Steroidobacteraceae bacterium]